MTNADCIRSMTDEELFNFIERCFWNNIDYTKAPCSLCEREVKGNDESTGCDGCLRWWLTLDCEEHPKGLRYRGIYHTKGT